MLKYCQARKTTLAVPLVSTETSEIVLKDLLDSYGNQVTFADFGDLGLMTIAPGTDNEEIISFGGFTVESNGNVTIDTSITRALLGVSPYGAGGTAHSHAAGTEVVFSNNPQMYQALKDYIDGVAVAGSPDASLTAKGIVEIATTAEIDAGTATGSTGAVLAITPDQFSSSKYAVDYVTSSAGAGDSGKVVKLNSDGEIPSGFLQVYFGDGTDGDVIISTPTTLTRDMYYDDLTVNSTLNTDGFRIYVKGTLSGSGTIAGKTGSNGGNAVTTTPGTAGASTGTGIFKTTVGIAGGDASAVVGIGTTGANGGAGGTGSGGGGGTGTGGAATQVNKFGILRSLTLQGTDFNSSGTLSVLKPAGQAGGGGLGGEGGSGRAGGGGSGASGGMVWIVANIWAGTFTISSTGGNGGNGANGTASNGGGGGGGAGGTGGSAVIIYRTKTWTGSYALTGGTGGTKGTGTGTGANGVNGSTGATGTSYEINILSLL